MKEELAVSKRREESLVVSNLTDFCDLRSQGKEKIGNPLIYTQPKKTLDSWIERKCYKRFCNYKDTRCAIRHIGDFLIREGVLGRRLFCETDGCNKIASIHRISYDFDEALKQENYRFLCGSHLNRTIRKQGVGKLWKRT